VEWNSRSPTVELKCPRVEIKEPGDHFVPAAHTAKPLRVAIGLRRGDVLHVELRHKVNRRLGNGVPRGTMLVLAKKIGSTARDV
jgi:hypothetical protein